MNNFDPFTLKAWKPQRWQAYLKHKSTLYSFLLPAGFKTGLEKSHRCSKQQPCLTACTLPTPPATSTVKMQNKFKATTMRSIHWIMSFLASYETSKHTAAPNTPSLVTGARQDLCFHVCGQLLTGHCHTPCRGKKNSLRVDSAFNLIHRKNGQQLNPCDHDRRSWHQDP